MFQRSVADRTCTLELKLFGARHEGRHALYVDSF
jgi:hypothetical protein